MEWARWIGEAFGTLRHLRRALMGKNNSEPVNIQERVSAILQAEAQALAAIHVTPEFERAVLALRDCRGKVLTSGMGKAGHVARKFASTLCSTGTPASYIHPGEAAHGDLGLVGPRRLHGRILNQRQDT